MDGYLVGADDRWEYLVSGSPLRQIGEVEPEAKQGEVCRKKHEDQACDGRSLSMFSSQSVKHQDAVRMRTTYAQERACSDACVSFSGVYHFAIFFRTDKLGICRHLVFCTSADRYSPAARS